MKICPICRKEYDGGDTCPKCGVPLMNKESKQAKTQKNSYYKAGETQEDNYYKPISDQNQKENNYYKQKDEIYKEPYLKNKTTEQHSGYQQSEKNTDSRDTISISKNALLGGIIAILCVALIIVSVKYFRGKNDKSSAEGTRVTQSDNQINDDTMTQNDAEATSDTTEETENTEAETQEEEGMTLPYTDNTYMAPGSCLSEADFASVTSEDGSFKFCYPKYIFNTFSYDDNQEEYYFAYEENGEEICSLRVYKSYNSNDNMINAAKNLRYKFEGNYSIPNYYWPAEDLSKLTSDSNSSYAEPRKDGISRYVMSGWTSSDRSQVLYCLGANDGVNDYILEFSYPDYNAEDDMEEFDYITECIYRDCSFSGTSYAVRSYDTYMSEGFKDGHH